MSLLTFSQSTVSMEIFVLFENGTGRPKLFVYNRINPAAKTSRNKILSNSFLIRESPHATIR